MSDKIGVAMIGVGFWGRKMAEAVQRTESLKVVSCCSRNAENRAAFAADFGCADSPSFEEAISHPEVQGVLLVTPNNIHAEHTQAAAALGKHVFVEKPIADSLEDGRAMLDACQSAGVTLAVGHAFRRLGAARKVKQILDEGLLGKVVLAEANFSLAGFLTSEKWRYYRKDNPGGPLMQLGIHHVDTLQYWLGPVTKVHGSLVRLHTPAEIDDVASAQLGFESGVIGTLNCSYVSPKTFDLRLYGTDAVIDYHTDMSVWPNAPQVDNATRLTMWTASEVKEIPFETRDMLSEELEEFAQCMLGNASPETGAEEGLNALQVVLGAVNSSENGGVVTLTN